jgi:hypothetical protein
MTRILDPTLRTASPSLASLAPRAPHLKGATNGKSNGMAILDRLAELLLERYGIRDVVRVAKTNASVPVSDEDAQLLAKHCEAVITAIGD